MNKDGVRKREKHRDARVTGAGDYAKWCWVKRGPCLRKRWERGLRIVRDTGGGGGAERREGNYKNNVGGSNSGGGQGEKKGFQKNVVDYAAKKGRGAFPYADKKIKMQLEGKRGELSE